MTMRLGSVRPLSWKGVKRTSEAMEIPGAGRGAIWLALPSGASLENLFGGSAHEEDRAPRQALGRPEFLHVVVDLHGRNVGGELHPGQLGAGEDMHVRRQSPAVVQ